MTLPLAPNTTCDVYHSPSSPPADPDVKNVPGYLTPIGYDRRLEVGDGDPVDLRYTHILLVDLNTDIRDGTSNMTTSGTHDTVWVPTQSGTKFVVKFVERAARGTALEHRRVYLDRDLPTWPTNEV